ncbi:hypothetical protein K438DRAFT_1980920 [Mycena galopus ATCC 62051]|nr:hypothetical protein K438DRAFT_1980920 [Mycena galopus ATCC 62051]
MYASFVREACENDKQPCGLTCLLPPEELTRCRARVGPTPARVPVATTSPQDCTPPLRATGKPPLGEPSSSVAAHASASLGGSAPPTLKTSPLHRLPPVLSTLLRNMAPAGHSQYGILSSPLPSPVSPPTQPSTPLPQSLDCSRMNSAASLDQDAFNRSNLVPIKGFNLRNVVTPFGPPATLCTNGVPADADIPLYRVRHKIISAKVSFYSNPLRAGSKQTFRMSPTADTTHPQRSTHDVRTSRPPMLTYRYIGSDTKPCLQGMSPIAGKTYPGRPTHNARTSRPSMPHPVKLGLTPNHVYKGCPPPLKPLNLDAQRITREHAIGSTLNHESCTAAFSGAGTYVILRAAQRLIDATQPMWSTNLPDENIKTINAFSKYDNVLAYNVGNEVLTSGATNAAPFIKAATRDIKAYLAFTSSSALVEYTDIDSTSDFRDAVADYLSRAFLVSLILTSKFTRDKCYFNRAWAKLSKIEKLEPVEQKISLHNLAVGTGFTGNATGKRGFSVGIDASGWMYRACCLHGSTESPELVVLFARCSRLFRLPFIPVFVFDGPARPRMKRGKVIRGNEHWLTSSFKLMLDGFGFEWIDAPGEAEATLAAMTASGIPLRVDAILPDDSDSFVFGASVVLRIRSEDNANCEASRYSAFDIATVLGLSRDDLVLDGLHGCGLAIAMGLARTGLGRQLVSGLEGQSHAGSMVFLAAWRELLRSELQTNASGCLPHRCKHLAASIPANFPDLEVINLYLHPVVVEHTSTRPLILRPPRLDVLARFAEDHFGWGDSVGILAHFADHLFAGLVVRDLVQRALAMDDLLSPLAVPSIINSIVRERHHKSTGFLAELRLMLDLDPTILISALQSIVGRRDPVQGTEAAVAAWFATDLPKVRVWVPKSMVEHVYPEIVLDYISEQMSKTTRTKKPKTRQGKIETYRPYTAASSSSITTGDPEGHAILGRNEQSGSSSLKVNCPLARPEKQYTAMSVTFRGQEVLELITDSEGEY